MCAPVQYFIILLFSIPHISPLRKKASLFTFDSIALIAFHPQASKPWGIQAIFNKNNLYARFVKRHVLTEAIANLSQNLNTRSAEEIKASYPFQQKFTAYNQQDVPEKDSDSAKSDVETLAHIGTINFINKVETSLNSGESSLVAELCTPTVNTKKLKKKNQIHRFFHSNAALASQLRKEIAASIDGEKALLNLWNRNLINNNNKVISHYDFYTINTTLADIWDFSSIITQMLWGLGENIYVNYTEEDKETRCKNALYFNIGIHTTNLKETPLRTLSQPHFFARFGIDLATLALAYVPNVPNDVKKHLPLISASLKSAYYFYPQYKQRTSDNEVELQRELIALASYFDQAQKIYAFSQKNPELKRLFPGFSTAYEDLCNDKETAPIIKILKKDTFKGKPHCLASRGNICFAAFKSSQNRNKFIKLNNEMGNIDKWLALNEYQEKYSSTTKFSEPVVTNRNGVYVKIKGGTHPGLPVNCIPNDIEFGGKKPSTVIMTGQNGSGKSFAGQMTALNILLAQTVNFCTAEECEISPFKQISYIANVKDKLGTKSRFQEEVEKLAQAYEKILNAADKRNNIFIDFDEPASGTKATKGADTINFSLEKISPLKNSAILIQTHLDLPEQSPLFQHVQVGEGENKFKVMPGKSDYSNTIEVVEQAFKAAEERVAAKRKR